MKELRTMLFKASQILFLQFSFYIFFVHTLYGQQTVVYNNAGVVAA
jgi:hypothetical protein